MVFVMRRSFEYRVVLCSELTLDVCECAHVYTHTNTYSRKHLGDLTTD